MVEISIPELGMLVVDASAAVEPVDFVSEGPGIAIERTFSELEQLTSSYFLKMGEKLLSVDLEKPRWMELQPS